MKLSQLLLGECAYTRAAKWTARHYYVKYSLLFVTVALIAFAPVVAEGKSLVNGAGDGLRQHYIALLYFGRWGRAVLSNLWAGHGLVVPMWDFTIGYGADVLTTFNYYAIGDPLNLLSIACPSRYTECLYSGLIVLRMYLAGLAFSAYCISKKKQKAAVLAGAIAYAFSGWAFQAGWSHPFFLNPLIYFPLLLMGFDRVFDNRSPVLFIIAVAISLASNFYFFYMLVIALACYALVKFLSLDTGGLMAFMRLFGKSVGFGAIGVLIASVVFVPVLLLFLGTDRLTADVTFSLIYDPAYYATFPATLITAALESNWTAVGISAPLLLGVIAATLGGGRYRVMQVCLLVSTAALLIPAAGWALNGFSYVSNRWTWAYVMLLCYVSVTALPAIVDYGKRQRLALISCVICFCLLLLVLHNWEPASAFVSAVILLISALCLVAILAHYERAKRWAPTVMIAFVAFGAAVNGVFVFSPAGGDVASRLVSWGSAIDRLSSTASPAMASLQSNGGGFCRFDQQPVSLRNVPVAFGANGVQFYWSLANGNVTTFLREMGLSNLTTSFECDSLDSRALLECVSSVSLYAGSEGTQPYGFEANGRSVQDRDNSLSVYEDADALPICYSYEEVMDRDDYEHLTAYEKQEAVVRYAVINDASSAFSVPVENANWNCKALCFNAALDGDARWSEDAALVVEKAGASLATEVEGQVDSESYLYIGEIGVESSDMPVVLVILVNDRETRLVYLPSRYRFTNKQTEFLVNLGPLRQGPNAIRIVFQTPGVYDLRRMELVTEPLSWLASAKNNRRNCSWNNEIIGVNEVSGSINLPNDRMLCFSVPFDKGWSLFVDGEQVDLMRVNTMFMGAKVSSGRHDVELRYETYGLRLGACLSFIGICVLAAIIVAYSKREFPQ